jgi:hypothetical protein
MFSLAEASAIDFVLLICCFTDACRERSLAACFCKVVSRKLLVEDTESTSLEIGALRLLVNLSSN